MAQSKEFKFDLSDKFPQLAHPPIVEAVLDWRVEVENEDSFRRENLPGILEQKLPDYPVRQDHYDTKLALRFNLADQTNQELERWGGWKGQRLTSSDKTRIAIVAQDRFVYSQLAPYPGWEQFSAEALRIWNIFKEIASPSPPGRIGLRYINRIPIDPNAHLRDYLKEPPSTPGNLPLVSFMYQSAFKVEREDLFAQVIKTFHESEDKSLGLVLDIDVFGQGKTAQKGAENLDEFLLKLRYLKNVAFFDLLSDSFTRTLTLESTT